MPIPNPRSVLAAGLALSALFGGNTEAGERTRFEIPGDAASPESIAAAKDGTLYRSSLASGGMTAIKPGATKAEPFIAPGCFGSRSIFFVLVDDSTG